MNAMQESLRMLIEKANYAEGAFWGPLLRDVARKQKRRNIIVVISEGGFRGNTKYAFLSLWRHIKECNLPVELYYIGNDHEISLLRSEGLPALSRETEWQKTALVMLNAKIALYDTHDFLDADRWFWQSCLDGAIKIQMWHGIPTKRGCAEYLSQTFSFCSFSGLLYDCYQTDFTIAENTLFMDVYQANFPRSQVLAFGSVRNDLLVQKDFVSSLWRLGIALPIVDFLENAKSNGKKIILCCPTYREKHDTSESFITAWLPAILSLSALPGVCVAFKMHPRIDHSSHFKRALHICTAAGVVFIPPDQDIQPYYTLADCLITDYSSVWLDYMLCKRPIIFYRPDITEYTQSRHLISYPFFDISNVGPVCLNKHELIKHTISELEHPSCLDQIKRIGDICHRNASDGLAHRRLFSLIQWILESASNSETLTRYRGDLS